MKNLSYEKKFRTEICDKKFLRFEKEDECIKADKTSLKPGGYIQIGSNAYSIGWRGWRTNNAGKYTDGLVTAAHGNSLNQMATTNSGNTFGKLVLRRFSGSLDAAFVQKTNSGYDVSNTIKFSGATLKDRYYMPSLCYGMKVHKVGMTTGLTSGKITNAIAENKYRDYPNISFTDFAEADYYGNKGDSGGLVYTDGGGYFVIVGIHTGYGGGRSCLVKASNIIDQMKVYPY